MYRTNNLHRSSKLFQDNVDDRNTFKEIVSIVYSPFLIMLGVAAYIA